MHESCVKLERGGLRQFQFCRRTGLPRLSYHVHVDAIGVGPSMLKVLLQSLSERVWYLVEADELLDPRHLGVVPGGTGVKPLNDG